MHAVNFSPMERAVGYANDFLSKIVAFRNVWFLKLFVIQGRIMKPKTPYCSKSSRLWQTSWTDFNGEL